LKSTVSGKEETSHWYLRGPYNITVGKPMRFNGDIEDHDLVKATAKQVMLKIMRLAFESEQRWNRNQRSLPGALETI
jgi:hypothetical protein